MAEYISNRQRQLNVGISSYTEDKLVLDVIGNVSVTGVTTLASAGGITTTGGDLYVGNNFYVKNNFSIENLSINNLNSSGIATIGEVTITSSGIITSSNPGVSTVYYYGDGSQLTNVYASISGVSSYSDLAGIATYATTAGIATVAQGLTGTPNISVGVITASSFVGDLTGTATTATNLSDAANITTGTISTSRLSGTYNINISGSSEYSNVSGVATYALTAGIATYTSIAGIATYALTAGISTVSQGLTGTPNITVGIATASSFVGDLTGTATTATNLSDAANITTGTISSSRLSGTYNINVSYADASGIATYATSSGISTYASTSGISTVAQGLTGTPNIVVGIVTASSFIGNLTGTATTATNVIGGIGSITSLSVSGITTTITLQVGTGGTIITTTENGNVGIGTTNPTTRLHIQGVLGFGTSNIRIGDNTTGPSITSGLHNFFAGVGAGQSHTSGVHNNFFGCGTGKNNLIGSYNNFFGRHAGVGNISGGFNNFLGAFAGACNTTGGNNNFFGKMAGFCNLNGCCNAFLGSCAGYFNSSGCNNSFFGHYAGFKNATGSFNVIIGAGRSSTPIQDGSNQLVIGAGSTDWIIGNSSYNVGIGTTNPTSKLHIVGNTLVSGIVTASSFVGDLTGTATTATKLENNRTFEITGDIIASPVSFNGTGNVSLAATIQPNSVGLGTDTTGDYVQSITGTANQITVTGGSGEGSTPVISIASNPTLPGNVTIANDLQVNNNLNVTGNITIGGTSAYIISNDFRVKDADIVVGYTTDSNGNDVSNDTTANHGGIAVASTEGTPLVQLYNVAIGETNPATYKKIMWFKSGSFTGLNTDAWLINYGVGIGSTQFPSGTRLAAGSVQITEYDLAVVRNINASGIITGSSFVPTSGYIKAPDGTNSFYIYSGTGNVAFQGTIGASQINNASGYKVIGFAATDATFENNVYIAGVTTSLGGFVGNLTGTATTATNLANAANITTGTINSSRLSGTYDINVSYASTAGIATNLKGGDTGDIPYQSSANNTTFVLASSAVSGQVLLWNGSYPEWSNVSAASGSFGGITVKDEGSTVGTANSIVTLDFVSPNLNVTATSGSNGIATVYLSNNLVGSGLSFSGISTLGTVNATEYYGTFKGTIDSGVSVVSSNYAAIAGVSTSVIGGIGSISQLQVTGISTFTNGPVLIGSGSSTGTSSQPLQVTGGSYVSGNLGIGTTNPTSKLHVVGDSYITGILTANRIFSNIYGEFTGGSIVGSNIVGTSLSISDLSTFNNGPVLIGSATSTGTTSQPLQITGGSYISGNLGIGSTTPSSKLYVVGDTYITGILTANRIFSNIYGEFTGGSISGTDIVGTALSISGISTLGSVRISSGIISATSGIVTYYGDGSNLTGVNAFNVVTQESSSNPVYPTFAQNIGVSSIGISTQQFVFIPSSGNLGLGTTSPTSKLYVVGDGYFTGILTANRIVSSVYGEFTGGSISGSNIVGTALSISGISTLGTVQISSGIVTATSGVVTYYGNGANLTNVPANLTITDDTSTNATRYLLFDDVTTGTITGANVSSTKLTFNPSTGNLIVGGTVTANSDQKLKENVQTIENALDKVLSLRGVEYTRIDNGDKQIGVIAQEVEQIIPEVVYPKQPVPDCDTKSVAYGNLIGLLIEAIKDQNKKIEELERKLGDL